MRRVLASAIVLAAVVGFMVVALGNGSGSANPTYRIELDDAFGLTNGAQFKVAGVPAGAISNIQVCGVVKHSGCQNPLHALVTVSITQSGFGAFHSDAFCQSRPQSLIGEYFLECQPGGKGPALKPGATITVAHTSSTIPADLLADVMRLPYRERLTLIINELGAAVAGRSGDLEAALHRAVPALDETDNLLNLLASDSGTINALTANSDQVITDLANNSKTVQHFIDEANNAATASATQQANISATWQQLPGFLEQLRPAMQQLGNATDANLPVVQNLNTASGELNRLFTDLPGFSHASLPALKALGQASVTGRTAVIAARPTIRDLQQFTGPANCTNKKINGCLPELAGNLNIVLHDLDNRSRAVEPDNRSPGGTGYTGLEALLQYVFNQAVAINTFGPLGHVLAVDGFVDPLCTPYATPQTLANNLAQGPQARRCYAWLGPNQPGVNETDPSNPSACVPDPGGAPTPATSSLYGLRGPQTTACKLSASATADLASLRITKAKVQPTTSTATTTTQSTASPPTTTTSSSSASSPPSSSRSSPALPNVGGVLGGLVSKIGGITVSTSPSSGAASSSSASSAGGVGSQAEQLLNYLLAP
jgi:virulence factor Mce-like protein